jgi:predicted secreted hydrolase
MRSRAPAWAVILLLGWPAGAQYQQAAPGYRYEFPRDHFNHPQFQTEWWYYTGNLTATDGRRFGFELTFFREGVDRPETAPDTWEVRDIYLAHLALSDLDRGNFFHSERVNRAGPGIAGAAEAEKRIWNGNWKVTWNNGSQKLEAIEDHFSVSFTLMPLKPPVIHGENGLSQKAAGTGHASHYISLTRLRTDGRVELGGTSYAVSGQAWMDHEFFTAQLASDQAGWDWVSVQLADHTELMLFRMRKKDGSADPFSSGTFVDAEGRATHLRSADFSMTPSGARWKSAETGATYPVEWNLAAPNLGLQLHVKTRLPSQELASKSPVAPSYWEGAVDVSGTHGNTSVEGVGYLEMTGYDRAVAFGASDNIPISR